MIAVSKYCTVIWPDIWEISIFIKHNLDNFYWLNIEFGTYLDPKMVFRTNAFPFRAVLWAFCLILAHFSQKSNYATNESALGLIDLQWDVLHCKMFLFSLRGHNLYWNVFRIEVGQYCFAAGHYLISCNKKSYTENFRIYIISLIVILSGPEHKIINQKSNREVFWVIIS